MKKKSAFVTNAWRRDSSLPFGSLHLKATFESRNPHSRGTDWALYIFLSPGAERGFASGLFWCFDSRTTDGADEFDDGHGGFTPIPEPSAPPYSE